MVGYLPELPGTGILIAAIFLSLALWFASPVALGVNPVVSPDTLQFDVRPAWGGYVRAGTVSEVQLQLLAGHGGSGRVAVRGSRAVVEEEIDFYPGVPLRLQLPVDHDAVHPLPVEVYLDNEVRAQGEAQLRLLPARARLLAVASTPGSGNFFPPEWLRNSDVLVRVPVENLPYFASSYDMLKALVITAAHIRSLAPEQALALETWLGRCGLIYLPGANETVLRALRSRAGCGGRNVFALAGGEAVPAPAGAATASIPATTLRELYPESDSGILGALSLLLIGYLLLLWFVSRSVRSPLPVLLLPGFTAALALLGWTLGAPIARTASWAEMDSGDAVARYNGLLQLAGTSRARQELRLDKHWGIPGSGQKQWIYYPRGERYLELQLDTLLMSTHEFVLRGVTPAPFLNVLAGAQAVEVVNHGQETSPPGMLAWRGEPYRVPALAVGESWRSPGQPDTWSGTPQAQLLRQRAVDGGTWLLLPFRVPALGALGDEGMSVGWLLVKGGEDA